MSPQGTWWEPFCGGLSVSVHLAKYGPGVVSDANPALIALYQAVIAGWDPPTAVSREEYQAAKSLPESDPRKAFIGFGCSFGGKWFGGYAESGKNWNHRDQRWDTHDYAKATAKALFRDMRAIANCAVACLSFFDVDPRTSPTPECIYADPPYEGTTGYSAVAPFDHGRFWTYCQEWASRGARVFVSEYTCSVEANIVWDTKHSTTVGTGTARAKESDAGARCERLFLVKPPSVARVA